MKKYKCAFMIGAGWLLFSVPCFDSWRVAVGGLGMFCIVGAFIKWVRELTMSDS